MWRWALTLPFCVLALASLVWCAPASALSQRGHVFSFSYGSKVSGEGGFSEPSGVAVNDVTGDVYVADHLNKRVVRLEPELGEKGELVGERFVASFDVPSPSSVAVDDSSESSDPSSGDVYVVGKNAHAIYKFTSEGVAVGKPLKTFVLRETGAKVTLEAIESIAVDRAGSLFVYLQDGEVYILSDAERNEGEFSMATGLTGEAEPGLALDSQDDVFVGQLGEGGFPVVAKLEGITGKLLIPQLDDEETTAVAVNTSDAPSNEVDELDDVYALNDGSVAQFAPETGGVPGGLIQRFPSEAEDEAHGGPILQRGAGVAVDSSTGAVYVTDAASDDVDVFELQPAGVPKVEGSSVQAAVPAAGGARRLSAQVDPAGADTRYYFEYGTASCSATPSACASTSPTDIGGGFESREVSLELRDLPAGEYHYRVIAENALGAIESPERAFPIFKLASALPDGRAWEMVSPPERHGAVIEALTREGGVILASEDGDALTYLTAGTITEEALGNRTPEQQQVLALRTAAGWSSQDIATPDFTVQGVSAGSPPEYQFFSSDLSLAVVQPWVSSTEEPPLAPGVTQKSVYLRDDRPIPPGAPERRSYEAAHANAGFLEPGFLPLESGYGFLGATPDLEHVVLSASEGLYEWSEGGKLQFLSELPDGAPALEPALGYRHVSANAISANGSRVIWSSREENGEGEHLYMRDTQTGQTIQLDAAQGAPEPQTGSAEFQTASSDGSRVFFTDRQRLTAESSASTEPTHEAADLYECEITEEAGKLACRLSDLTVDHHTAGEHAAVQEFLLGAGDQGSTIYLVAQGVLAGNENGNDETAEAGKDNLYELDSSAASGKWQTTFVARLSSEDGREWEGATDGNTSYLTARVSPNGRYLAFMSAASPTGYDNVDQRSGQRDEEVYLYDSASASLRCVSCDPTGAPPVGVLDTVDSGEGLGLLVDNRGVWLGDWLAGNIPGWTARSIDSALYQSRYLSNEGRLFFNSPDDLTPQATNHKNDVYEYEPTGVGSCETTSGCVALISGGSSESESAFLEATPSGNDAFFLTAAPLSPEAEGGDNIYDARVCTGESSCLTGPSGPRAPCGSVTECHAGSSSGQAPLEPSGSATYSGQGNIAPPAGNHEIKGVGVTSKPLTRAQKLTKALAACKKDKQKSKRAACQKQARKRYGPAKPKAKKSTGKETGR